MRSRHWLIAPLILLVLGGCAGSKPCMVIPAQLELATDTRDAAQETLNKKRKDMERWQNAITQSQTRIARLTEDRDRLREEVGVVDTYKPESGTEGKK